VQPRRSLHARILTYLLLSTAPAPGPRVRHPSAPNACTRLQNRVVVSQTTVGANGEARWSLTVPTTVPTTVPPGAVASFQAVLDAAPTSDRAAW
jgi:hypothetical protein